MKMPSVDPIEIMLSEIFDKVFYNKHQGPRAEVALDRDWETQ
jgi:hypothetical protein